MVVGTARYDPKWDVVRCKCITKKKMKKRYNKPAILISLHHRALLIIHMHEDSRQRPVAVIALFHTLIEQTISEKWFDLILRDSNCCGKDFLVSALTLPPNSIITQIEQILKRVHLFHNPNMLIVKYTNSIDSWAGVP